MKKVTSCGAIIVCDDEFLIVKHAERYGGHWDFPKGGVEAGEDELQTATREVLEETGIKVSILDGFREEVHYYPKPEIFKTVVWFLGFVVSKKVKIAETELTGYKWLKFEDALKQLNYVNSREVLKKANAFLQDR